MDKPRNRIVVTEGQNHRVTTTDLPANVLYFQTIVTEGRKHRLMIDHPVNILYFQTIVGSISEHTHQPLSGQDFQQREQFGAIFEVFDQVVDFQWRYPLRK